MLHQIYGFRHCYIIFRQCSISLANGVVLEDIFKLNYMYKIRLYILKKLKTKKIIHVRKKEIIKQ